MHRRHRGGAGFRSRETGSLQVFLVLPSAQFLTAWQRWCLRKHACPWQLPGPGRLSSLGSRPFPPNQNLSLAPPTGHGPVCRRLSRSESRAWEAAMAGLHCRCSLSPSPSHVPRVLGAPASCRRSFWGPHFNSRGDKKSTRPWWFQSGGCWFTSQLLPCTHVGDAERALGSWLWPGPVLATW